jgi:hypothetical protein
MLKHIQTLIKAGITRKEAKQMLQQIARFNTKIWDNEAIVAAIAGGFYNEECSNRPQVLEIAKGLRGLLSLYSSPKKMMDDYKVITSCFPIRNKPGMYHQI